MWYISAERDVCVKTSACDGSSTNLTTVIEKAPLILSRSLSFSHHATILVTTKLNQADQRSKEKTHASCRIRLLGGTYIYIYRANRLQHAL